MTQILLACPTVGRKPEEDSSGCLVPAMVEHVAKASKNKFALRDADINDQGLRVLGLQRSGTNACKDIAALHLLTSDPLELLRARGMAVALAQFKGQKDILMPSKVEDVLDLARVLACIIGRPDGVTREQMDSGMRILREHIPVIGEYGTVCF